MVFKLGHKVNEKYVTPEIKKRIVESYKHNPKLNNKTFLTKKYNLSRHIINRILKEADEPSNDLTE
jgi:hypothetical protein